MKKIKLGSAVMDRISGLEGIAVSRVEYLNECVQYGIQGESKDGKIPESQYIDEQQLIITDVGFVTEKEELPPGGPSSFAPNGRGLAP